MTKILVSHEHQFIWVAVAKVASMSIQAAILRKLGVPFCQWRRVSLDSMEQVQRLGHYFRFAFVRNPWARLLSCYLDKIIGPTRRPQRFILDGGRFRPGMPFEAFVRRVAEIDDAEADPHFVSQFYTLSCAGRLCVDYVGRFETLTRDWEQVRRRFDLPPLAWAPVGSLRRRDDFRFHKPYYTTRLVDMVAARYADDVSRFGYEY